MYLQVPEYYRTVSEWVSHILDVIGYSQKDRDRKVRHAAGFEDFENIFQTNKSGICYMFGSRGEGSTGPGLHSDRDILFSIDSITAINDISDFHPGKTNFLMVLDEWTHPGYVKLQIVTILPDNTPVPQFHFEGQYSRVDSYGRTVASNKFIHDSPWHTTLTGPALHSASSLKELSTDYVYGIRHTQWPNEAHEWFQRRRLHGWPKIHCIRNAQKDGCFATAVGHTHSHEKDLEWRLSFSITERNVTRSFEDTVMKVYILLKMIRKTYIEPVLGDAFSSYHCKVCMLWMREKTPPELWRTENILYCLTLCIKQLYEWVNVGYCPDYFIVTNNIYDRKIFGAAQFILTRILGVLVSEDCRLLLGLECCNLGQLLSDCSNLNNIHSLVDIGKDCFLEAFTDNDLIVRSAIYWRSRMLRDIPQEYDILTSLIRRIMHALQRAPHTLRIYLHYILMNVLARLGFYVVSVCKENAHSLSQEEIDHLVGLASRCLSLGINSDATSVRLKLCGLGTMFGYYDMTEICLQHISDQHIRCMFWGTLDKTYVLPYNVDLHVVNTFMERNSIEELLQNQLFYSVVYLPSETSITPLALRMEMFRSIGAPTVVRDEEEHYWYDWAVVDSVMTLYFFQYLIFFRLGKKRHQQAAMENMIHAIRSETNILHRDTGLNLLGYSFMRETHFRNAFIYFYKSLTIRPHSNAAKFYLGILFRKVHVSRRGGERN